MLIYLNNRGKGFLNRPRNSRILTTPSTWPRRFNKDSEFRYTVRSDLGASNGLANAVVCGDGKGGFVESWEMSVNSEPSVCKWLILTMMAHLILSSREPNRAIRRTFYDLPWGRHRSIHSKQITNLGQAT